jgi:glutamyl-Q tRNA(Asp) synthetase
MPWVTRFAPSPTGRLHLGHVFAAQVAWRRARDSGGWFFLRHEDIDTSRCRDEWREAAEHDLRWLRLDWDGEAVIQSHRQSAHQEALEKLRALGVLYPCFCTRREIQDEIARMGGAPQGPDGPLYPGTCKSLSDSERANRLGTVHEPAWRIDVAKAMEMTGPLEWHDLRHGPQIARPECLGDAILARKDAGTSYHLAVVVDDAWQEINLVTRGEDLLPSTHLHRLLQALLGLAVPEWEHHTLVRDAEGRRLAKRHDDLAVATFREAGWTPDQVLREAIRLATA